MTTKLQLIIIIIIIIIIITKCLDVAPYILVLGRHEKVSENPAVLVLNVEEVKTAVWQEKLWFLCAKSHGVTYQKNR